MKFSVLQEDIDNGEKGDPYACPVTLAICRQLPESDGAITGKNYVVIHDPVTGKDIRYQTPLSVYKFVRKFDKGKQVKPFDFTINTDRKPRTSKIPLPEFRASAEKR